jgi:hypothetical protein
MFKSESVDGDRSCGGGSVGGDLRMDLRSKPRLFRRSVTVPSEILSGASDHKILDLDMVNNFAI